MAKAKNRVGDEPTTSSPAAAASETAKKHLIVELIDRSYKLTQMSQERGKVAEVKVLDNLFEKMDAEPVYRRQNDNMQNDILFWIKESVKPLQCL